MQRATGSAKSKPGNAFDGSDTAPANGERLSGANKPAVKPQQNAGGNKRIAVPAPQAVVFKNPLRREAVLATWHKSFWSWLMPFARFDYSLDYKKLDLRKHPERYRTGVGEQGVLLVEPYKSEILPHWKFKTPDLAKKSSARIYKLFLAYKKANDFVGMDMARKFLQMGYTRSRRYANHKNGKKYDGPVPADKKGQSGAHGRRQLPPEADPVKAQSASVFYDVWQKAKADKTYQKRLTEHKEFYKEKGISNG